MNQEQFDAAMNHYLSPRADPFAQVFIHRDSSGHEEPISIYLLLETANNEISRREAEALKFRALRDYVMKYIIPSGVCFTQIEELVK